MLPSSLARSNRAAWSASVKTLSSTALMLPTRAAAPFAFAPSISALVLRTMISDAINLVRLSMLGEWVCVRRACAWQQASCHTRCEVTTFGCQQMMKPISAYLIRCQTV